MKRILLALLAVCPLFATTVTGPVKTPVIGSSFTGRITITPSSQWTNASSQIVAQAPINVTVTAGVFSVDLEPTDTATSPSNPYYTFTFFPTGAKSSYSLRYSVPTSETPITIAQLGLLTVTAAPTYDYVTTNRAVNVVAPLTGGGALYGDLTIRCDMCAITEGTPAENDCAKFDAEGHVVSAGAPCGSGGGGGGSGDASTNTSSSVDSELALFSGTSGKTLKRATGTGIAKITGGVLSTATAGTDYVAATSGSAIQKANGSGGLTAATSGTDYAPATSGSAILKGNGAGGFSAAAAGTDYAAANASTTVNGTTCALGSTCTVADTTKVPTTTAVNGHALSANVTVTASDVGLGSVTNDAQTKAAIVPNTVPSAGQILAGNSGGTAYAPVAMSGDAAMTSAGAVTVTKINGATGTTGTVLHGNTSGAPAFSAIVASDVPVSLSSTTSVNGTPIPASATLARTDVGNTFSGHQTMEGVTATGATGTQKHVYSDSPTFTGTLTGAIATFSGALTAGNTLDITGTGPMVQEFGDENGLLAAGGGLTTGWVGATGRPDCTLFQLPTSNPSGNNRVPIWGAPVAGSPCATAPFSAWANLASRTGANTYSGSGLQDYSQVPTRPFQSDVVANIPATCSAGQHYYATDTGRDYTCTAANTWQPSATPNAAGTGFVDRTGTNAAATRTLTGSGIIGVTNGGGGGNPTFSINQVCKDTGTTASAIACTISLASTVVDGTPIAISPGADSTGATTVAINGGTAAPITYRDNTALRSGELVTGNWYLIVWDATATKWRLQTSKRGGSSLTVATTTGTLTNGNCVAIDSNGNLVDAATTCGASGTFAGQVVMSGVISPTALSANVNNYAPTGLSTASVIRLTTDNSGSKNITGITAQPDGTKLWLFNIGATDSINLVNASASSSAANRFCFDSAANLSLRVGAGIAIHYDNTSTCWRSVNGIVSLTTQVSGSLQKAQTPLTTKGDIWVTDGTNMHRLGVGADGTVLTADAASTDGVKWNAAAGGGDAFTNTSTSVDSEVAVFSGTAGKTLKRATGTGTVYLNSGVISAVTPSVVQAEKLSTPAVGDGSTGDTSAFNSASSGQTVLLRNGATYIMDAAWTPAANTTWICGANTVIKKQAGTTTTYMLNPTTANVTIDGCTFDPNGVLKGSGNLYSIFVSGATNIRFRNVRFANSGTVQPTMGAFLVYNSSGIIENPKFDNTIGGTHIKIDATSGKYFKVANIQSDGSQENGVQITVSSGYTAESVPVNVEIAGGRISNVTDRTGVSTGPLGNGVNIFQADGGVLVHDLTTDTTRFSGIRSTTSNNVKIYNNVVKNAGETGIYCSELGGIRNECDNNTIIDSVSGINMTNVSARSGTGGADDMNRASNTTCRNVRDYCVHTEHDIVGGVTKCDGVVACVTVGYGNTSHDNVVGQVISTRSNSAYPKPVGAILVDKSINTGTDIISPNVVNLGGTTTAPVIPVSFSDGAVISGITKANPAVVSYSNTPTVTPAIGQVWCFRAIGGMVEMNGQCAAITAVSAGVSMTFGSIDSTGYTTFANPTGGPSSGAFLLYSSGTTLQYSLPSSVATGSGGTPVYTANNLSVMAATTSAELLGVLSDETGTGAAVFGTSPTISAPTISGHPVVEGVTSTGATGTGKFVFDGSPTLVTPTIGVATATSINKWTLTAPTTAATLIAGGDSQTYTLPAATDTIVGRASTDTLTNKTLTSPALTNLIAATAIAAPSTPSAGVGRIYVDSTSKNIAVKDDAGVVKHGVQTATCTNQAATAISDAGAVTCTTLTSAYVNTSIAQTGVDINTSHQVTVTHLASALPVNQGGTGTTSTLTGLVRGSGSAMTAAEISGDGTTSGSNALTVTKINGKTLTVPLGVAVGDPAGSALATGVLGYIVVPTACTITGWDIVVDAGTATVDVWKIATGTAKPTVANTITASAKPAISTGTAIHSTTLTSWTTSVSANDILGFNLDAVATAKYITVNVQCAI